MLKVLTFSTNISAGHRRAAEAVAQAVMAAAPGSEIRARDAMMLMGPGRRRILTDTYLGILKYQPELWNSLYHSKAIKGGINRLVGLFMARSYEIFESEIDTFHPDVIICTQAIPARIIADLKQSGRCEAPLIAVATDYGIHPYWAHPGIDRYAVPCAAARDELMADDVARSKIEVTGIPVHEVFERLPSRGAARAELGLPSEGSLILLMGGGNGLRITVDDVRAVERTPGVDGVVLIAGCNEKLFDAVDELPRSPGKFRMLKSTVTGIERYYAACDVLVSKPGGLTMAEATAAGLPIVMVAPLPGQEVRNANFLVRAGAAAMARGSGELSGILFRLLADPLRLNALAEVSASIGRPDAARRIARMALAPTNVGCMSGLN